MAFAARKGDNSAMLHQRTRLAVAFFAGLFVLAFVPALRVHAAADTIPARLSDEEFWKLSQDMSEPNGQFRSDNILSNEIYFQYVIKELVAKTQPNGVYLGVGPEQNFTYIAAIKPKIAFITDVRRGNLDMHL